MLRALCPHVFILTGKKKILCSMDMSQDLPAATQQSWKASAWHEVVSPSPFSPLSFSSQSLEISFLHPLSSIQAVDHPPSSVFPELGSFFSFFFLLYPAIHRGGKVMFPEKKPLELALQAKVKPSRKALL